jgi:hypothetical protein
MRTFRAQRALKFAGQQNDALECWTRGRIGRHGDLDWRVHIPVQVLDFQACSVVTLLVKCLSVSPPPDPITVSRHVSSPAAEVCEPWNDSKVVVNMLDSTKPTSNVAVDTTLIEMKAISTKPRNHD